MASTSRCFYSNSTEQLKLGTHRITRRRVVEVKVHSVAPQMMTIYRHVDEVRGRLYRGECQNIPGTKGQLEI